MIMYSLGVIPLFMELQEAHQKFSQPWYVDDAGSGGIFPRILFHIDNIMMCVSPRGGLLDPTKSILVVSLHNIARVERFLGGKDSPSSQVADTWRVILGMPYRRHSG